MLNWLFLVIGIVSGIFLGLVYFRSVERKRLEAAGRTKEVILEDAKREAKNLKQQAEIQAKEYWKEEKKKFERETQSVRKDIEREKKRIDEKELQVDKRNEVLSRKEKELKTNERELQERQKTFKAKETRVDELLNQEIKKLEEVGRLTREEAKSELMRSLENEARHDAAQLAYKIREEAKEKAVTEAKNVIALAIQRCASSHTAETTVSVVMLPQEEMKGRIIGREGRNIRTFEAVTGVEIVIDDTPEAVTVSAFDPKRREVAKLALERLLQDGRIHPTRIEEIVNKVREEFDLHVKSIGENMALELGITGLHSELVMILGQMKFRTSYGQNLLLHSKEVAQLTGLMAGELNLNVELARRAGLLHDVGKMLNENVEGPHALIGAQFAKKYGESDLVVNAIAAHHEETDYTSPIAILVAAADAISGSRPGARRENIEAYLKRIEKLEEIAAGFTGVERAYAIQAGREIRIMVESNKISDAEAFEIAKGIAQKIESVLEYPGQIKVTVIRETRAIEYAK